MDELGGEACCAASRALTCTAVEVAQLCTVDCMPSVAATGRRPQTSPASSCPAQVLHWGHPQDPRRPRTGRDLQWHRNVWSLPILFVCVQSFVFSKGLFLVCVHLFTVYAQCAV